MLSIYSYNMSKHVPWNTYLFLYITIQVSIRAFRTLFSIMFAFMNTFKNEACIECLGASTGD